MNVVMFKLSNAGYSCRTLARDSSRSFMRPLNLLSHTQTKGNTVYSVAQKSKPLQNDQKIILNRIKACESDKIYSSN